MGAGQSVQMTRDAIMGEQYLHDCEVTQRIVSKAFDKCVAGELSAASVHELSAAERACVEEYSYLYANFLKAGFAQHAHLYEQYQREMYEKARMAAMMAQGHKDAASMRGGAR